MERNSKSGLENEILGKKGIALLVGSAFCPVPVLGEALGAGFLYPIIKTMPSPFGGEGARGYAISFIAASLARLEFYDSFYFPMLKKIYSLF